MTPGPFSAERDEALPDQCRDVWRIVADGAREVMRRHGTTARPHYIATVYSREDADHIVMLLNADDREREAIAMLRAVLELVRTDEYRTGEQQAVVRAAREMVR